MKKKKNPPHPFHWMRCMTRSNGCVVRKKAIEVCRSVTNESWKAIKSTLPNAWGLRWFILKIASRYPCDGISRWLSAWSISTGCWKAVTRHIPMVAFTIWCMLFSTLRSMPLPWNVTIICRKMQKNLGNKCSLFAYPSCTCPLLCVKMFYECYLLFISCIDRWWTIS